jgi:hypothetical protein
MGPMTNEQRETVEQANKNWKARIVEEFDEMALAIIELRDLVDQGGDANLRAKVEKLHLIYCDMANTISLRVLLNGVARELGCPDDAD